MRTEPTRLPQFKTSNIFQRLHRIPHEGGWIPGENRYHCRICEISVGFEQEHWIQHLISYPHQSIHRANQHLRKVLWDLDKKVCIKQVGGVLSENILRYLCSIGPVLDFSYLAKRDKGIATCYALFKNR